LLCDRDCGELISDTIESVADEETCNEDLIHEIEEAVKEALMDKARKAMEKYIQTNDTEKMMEAWGEFEDNHLTVFSDKLHEYCVEHPDDDIQCDEECTADLYKNLLNDTKDDEGNSKNCSGR